MVKINLLPWRAELRERRKREFLLVCGATFLLSLLLAGAIWLYHQNRLDDQLQANQVITTANSDLDRQLESLKGLEGRRQDIVDRMKVIGDLQGRRPVSVRVFDELARLIPSNLYLTKLTRVDNKFTLEGRAESPNNVSELIRNLENSAWFQRAFMNSYTGTEVKPPDPSQSGGVLPRPETNYGQFVITVDLEEPAEGLPAEATAATVGAPGPGLAPGGVVVASPAGAPLPPAGPGSPAPVVQQTTTTTTTQVSTTPQATVVSQSGGAQ